MKSTTALKMACLSVGLATAWSPLGGQTARADTQVDVNLNIGTSSGSSPGPFTSVAMGLVFTDNTYEIHDFVSNQLGGGYAPSEDGYDLQFTAVGVDMDQIAGVITVGLALSDPADLSPTTHVMVSIASLEGGLTPTWDQISTGYDETNAASDLHAFLNSILSIPPTNDNPPNFLYSLVHVNLVAAPGVDAGLFEFSTTGVQMGDVTVFLDAVTVPLPNACLMGGGLFALMALSKRTVKWIHLRQPQSLV